MKFTVEIEEFWVDQETDLLPEIHNQVVSDVARQIVKQLQARIDTEVALEVKSQANKKLAEQIEKAVADAIEIGTIPGQYSNSPRLTLEEYVKDKFEREGSTDRNIGKMVMAESVRYAESIKERYDILFVTGIVQKMNEQGMLKESVGNVLLGKS